MTRDQAGALTEVLLIVLDNRRDRGLVPDQEWTRLATMLSARAAGWLRDADDVGAVDAAAP